MRFPLPLTLKIARSILSHRLRGVRKFATVLQLEPLHTCNLSCTGCGRIREYATSLKEMMPLEECLAAAAECDAPMVSLCGGEPLLYPRIAELVGGLRAQGRIVYLCTNALLMRRKLRESLASRWVRSQARAEAVVSRLLSEELLSPEEAAAIRKPRQQPVLPAIEPSPWFYWNVHLDGLEATHDRNVERRGVFREAIQAIRMAKHLGFQVATNTTVYRHTDMAEIEDLLVFLGSLGVDGHTLTPGYGFAEAGREMEARHQQRPEDYFLTRDATVNKFWFVEEWGRRYPLYGTPAYLEFLAGKRQLACSAWAIPTRNVRGWRGPCYLIADAHYASYAEMLASTDWSRFETGRDPRCEHCMVHCGYEPTASLGIGARPGDLWRNFWFQFGPRPRVKLHPVHAFNGGSSPS
ncbi:MAG: DUF3463 domain-containing protein [Verrucomicrobiota bacterium]